MGFPPYLVRQYSYRQLQLAGLDSVPDPAKLDAELNAIVAAYNALAKRERAYTTPSGSLTQVPTAASLSLSSSTRFVATAGQTAFVVPTYDTGTDTVEVWYGAAGSGMSMLDPNNVTKTDTTHVTIPAQSLGAIVVILVFSTGAGVLATLAIDGTSGGTSGATLIGFYGSGLFTSHTVEAALVEFRTTYNAFISALGSIGNVLLADGTVPLTGDLDADGNKVIGLSPGSTAGDAVEYSQFSTFASIWNSLQAYYAKLDGTTPWTGDWDAGSHRLTNLAAAVAANDAVILSQFNLGAIQIGKNAVVNGSCAVAQGLDYVASVAGTFDYGKTDMFIGALAGTVVAGTLTQGTATPPGSSGNSVKWSAVTLTGAGSVTLRHYMESKNAVRFAHNQGYVGINVKHSCLAAITVTINVYTPNAADNFSGGMSLVGTAAQSVAPATDVRMTMTPLASAIANAVNGVCIEVVFSTGACAGITCEAADWQMETGGYSQMEYEDYGITLRKSQRYYYRWVSNGSTVGAFGYNYSTTAAYMTLPFPAEMRTIPTFAAGTSAGQFNVAENLGAAVACNVLPLALGVPSSTTVGIFQAQVAAGLTQYRPCWLLVTTASYMAFSARLT